MYIAMYVYSITQVIQEDIIVDTFFFDSEPPKIALCLILHLVENYSTYKSSELTYENVIISSIKNFTKVKLYVN